MYRVCMCDRYHKTLLSLLLALISLTILANGATDCSLDTKEYVKKVNELNYPEMYGDYPELKTIQSQTVSSLQGRPCLDKETKNYVDIIVKIINTYNELYSLSESNIPENHESAITKAELIKPDIESLEIYKESREKYYPLLIKISLRKFYKNEAEYFENRVKNERNTNNKIKFSLNEARAYKNIGDPKYAEISYRAEAEKAAYDYDINLIKEAIQNSNDFLNYADSNVKGFFTSIELFGKGFKLEESIIYANKLSIHHEEDQLKNLGDELTGKIQIIKKEAAASIIKYILIISVIYLIVSLYFSGSITRWKKEIDNVDLGNDLLEGLTLE